MTAAKPPSPHRLPLLVHAGYGAGQIAGQVFRDAPSLLLLFFMTNALGVEPALAGAAIFFPKLFWGLISDLTVGLVSDRWKAKIRGHRRSAGRPHRGRLRRRHGQDSQHRQR